MQGGRNTMIDPKSDKALDRFCSRFEARIKESDMHFYRASLPKFDKFSLGAVQTVQLEKEKGVAIHIPMHRFQSFVDSLPGHLKELDIRHQHPAVKKAYEQYMTVLAMCGDNYAGS